MKLEVGKTYICKGKNFTTGYYDLNQEDVKILDYSPVTNFFDGGRIANFFSSGLSEKGLYMLFEKEPDVKNETSINLYQVAAEYTI